ncbi:MAG: hypothetical protein A3F83_00880 [Candidatus Glassbacteria bacterium RIFCSPLOWO2_12_FULL_58_11]|uniref:HAD family hydrolase n=1 Tax=Candidatus Glassbacteria bacterium RIFCSPLOWO2_12_FULL_58_11 TaxID=1817867 RepID=A0A1F5YX02_9BACT|nr:MAG: hypothetical protein A3F83_00880 [Candidatus Glassbacteria bacterium RIFCSPLOWO2_12_FULL_58_11]
MIKNILFDIGSVLLQFDREATIREYSCYSGIAAPAELAFESVFLPGQWQKMETGEMKSEEYYELFIKASGCRISFRHFCLIWCMHFREDREMIALGRALASKFKLYFLSNTGPLHIPGLYDRFPSLLFFHGQALSWDLGVLKPDPAFFARALDKFSLRAPECLFIDDQLCNVETARALGIQSIQHLSAEKTAAAISAALDLDGASPEL